MLLGDVLSLRQLSTPVKIIVFKNDSLAFVELEMKAAGILDFGTGLQNPNFAKMAEGAGLLGLTAETPAQVRPMIAQALKHDVWFAKTLADFEINNIAALPAPVLL